MSNENEQDEGADKVQKFHFFWQTGSLKIEILYMAVSPFLLSVPLFCQGPTLANILVFKNASSFSASNHLFQRSPTEFTF